MIPERYRRVLPPQWYENEVATYHFEGAVTAINAFDAQREDLLLQLSPWSATWGLNIWDWIYFGQKQALSVEERRKNIQRKHWSRLPFTIPVLYSLGQTGGDLLGVKEDFDSKEIHFEYSTDAPIRLVELYNLFERIRPVHVNRCLAVVTDKAPEILVDISHRIFEVGYPSCNAYFCNDIPVEPLSSPVFFSNGQVIFASSE